MGKSAYALCGQAAGVGIPVGCVRIATAALRSAALRYCEEGIFA